jgi:hypothetical protein
MGQMKAQDEERKLIENNISRMMEKLVGHPVKILRVSLHQSHLDEIKIYEMNDKKDQDDQSCPDHELREKRALRIVGDLVLLSPGHPVLDLKDDPINDMYQESGQQNDFKAFDQPECCHEMGCVIKGLGIAFQQQKIYSQMYRQEKD